MYTSPILALIAVLVLTGPATAGESDPQLAGNSFMVYHTTRDGQAHRCSLKFTRQGATMDLFDGLIIPASGTLKTKRQGRHGKSISKFNAQGESPYGKGTLSFTAAKDGDGAKGSVTLNVPGKEPIIIQFNGTAPPK